MVLPTNNSTGHNIYDVTTALFSIFDGQPVRTYLGLWNWDGL
jgi:hypothetical protein